MRFRRNRQALVAVAVLLGAGALVWAHRNSDRQRRIQACVEETQATSDDLCARMEDVGRLPLVVAATR